MRSSERQGITEKVWKSPVPMVMSTPMSAIYHEVAVEGKDWPVNLAVLVSGDIAKMKPSVALNDELKQADLYHPKPRETERRPFKSYGDYLLRYVGTSRLLRTAVAQKVEQIVAAGEELDVTHGLYLVKESIQDYVEARNLPSFFGKNINIPKKELDKMVSRVDTLIEQIRQNDELAISIGLTFNQFLYWMVDNQQLAFLGFRQVDPFVARLSGENFLTFSAGIVDLVAIEVPPGGRVSAEEIEEYVRRIKNKSRKSGISLQQILGIEEVQELLLRENYLCRIIDYKQHSVAPNAQVLVAEDVQLTKYYVANFPFKCRKSGDGIEISGGVKGLPGIAKSIALDILDLRHDHYHERRVSVPDSTNKLLNRKIMETLYAEKRSHSGWLKIKKEIDQTENVEDITLLDAEFTPELITPEYYSFPAVIKKIRERSPRREIYSRNAQIELASDMKTVLEQLLASGAVKLEGNLAGHTITRIYEKLSTATTYQTIYELYSQFKGISTAEGSEISKAKHAFDELHLRYMESLEKRFPELAYFRSVIESSVKTKKISYYDAILIMFNNISTESLVTKIMARHPDGTIVIDLHLPNFPEVVTLALPRNSNRLYFYTTKTLKIFNSQLRQYGGPPYFPLKGLEKSRGKVEIIQPDKRLVDEANILRLLRPFYGYIFKRDFPFIREKALSRFEIDRHLRNLHDSLLTVSPQQAILNKLGIPKHIAIEALQLRFTAGSAEEGIEAIGNLGFSKDQQLQLGFTKSTSSTWDKITYFYLPDCVVFPVTDLTPIQDAEYNRQVHLTGFALQRVRADKKPYKLFQWRPPLIPAESGKYYHVGDIATAKKVCVTGSVLDAATLYTMFATFDLDLSEICVMAPIEDNYAKLAEDIKNLRKNFSQIERVEVLRGKWKTNVLTDVLNAHGLEEMVKKKEVSTEFWDLVKEALVLKVPQLQVKSTHTTVSKLWQELLQKTNGKGANAGILWPNDTAKEQVEQFVRALYYAMF